MIVAMQSLAGVLGLFSSFSFSNNISFELIHNPFNTFKWFIYAEAPGDEASVLLV